MAHRPSIARKSSAQNLLSQFKSTNSASSSNLSTLPGSSNVTSNTVVNGGGVNAMQSFTTAGTSTAANSIISSSVGVIPGSSGMGGGSSAGAHTPTTVQTPMQREWDAQSMHSESVAGGSAAMSGAVSPQLGQGMSIEYLRELVQKRILTLTYIRNIHEGQGHWFHTIQISKNELSMAFNNNDMKKRTARFAILGLSLSSLLDIHQPQDLLRGLLNTITEYDQSKEEGEKSKMRLFKSKNLRRGTGAAIPEFSNISEGDTSYLFTPHIPFALDYHETLMSLIDVVSEVYNKISKLLGPSPFHPSHHMMGPLGLLTPLPGVSYLFHGDNVTASSFPHPSNQSMSSGTAGSVSSHYPSSMNSHTLVGGSSSLGHDGELASSLWGIANASLSAPGIAGPSSSMIFGNGPAGAGGGAAAPNWTPNLGDMVLKIDGKLKKITTMLLKDLDELARNGIKDELASLEPLLKNRPPEGTQAIPISLRGQASSQPSAQYEYEAI